MAQVNFHTTPAFERALAVLMQHRGISSRSAAIRAAVEEAAMRAEMRPRADFSTWIGASLVGPENPRPQFTSDGDLWRDP